MKIKEIEPIFGFVKRNAFVPLEEGGGESIFSCLWVRIGIKYPIGSKRYGGFAFHGEYAANNPGRVKGRIRRGETL